jgi:hypothetical protein
MCDSDSWRKGVDTAAAAAAQVEAGGGGGGGAAVAAYAKRRSGEGARPWLPTCGADATAMGADATPAATPSGGIKDAIELGWGGREGPAAAAAAPPPPRAAGATGTAG